MIEVKLFNQPIFSFLFLCISNTERAQTANNIQIHIDALAPETIKQPVKQKKSISKNKQDHLIKKTMSLKDFVFFSLIQLIVVSVSYLLTSFFWERKTHYFYSSKLIPEGKYKLFCHIDNSTNFYETMAYFFIMCLAIGFFFLHTYCLKIFNIPVGFSLFYFLSSWPFCLRNNLSFFRFLSFFNPICFYRQTTCSIKYIAISLHDNNGKKKAKTTTKEKINHFMKCYFLIMLFFILIQLFIIIIIERKSYNIFFVLPNFLLFRRLCLFNFYNNNELILNTGIRISLIDTDQKKQTIGNISVLMCSPKAGKNWDTEEITIENTDNFIFFQDQAKLKILFLEELTQPPNPKSQFHLIFRNKACNELFGVIKGQEQYTNENILVVRGSYEDQSHEY